MSEQEPHRTLPSMRPTRACMDVMGRLHGAVRHRSRDRSTSLRIYCPYKIQSVPPRRNYGEVIHERRRAWPETSRRLPPRWFVVTAWHVHRLIFQGPAIGMRSWLKLRDEAQLAHLGAAEVRDALRTVGTIPGRRIDGDRSLVLLVHEEERLPATVMSQRVMRGGEEPSSDPPAGVRGMHEEQEHLTVRRVGGRVPEDLVGRVNRDRRSHGDPLVVSRAPIHEMPPRALGNRV